MSRTRAPYPADFRQQMVDLVRSGRSPEEVAREFEPSAQTIRSQIVPAARDSGERSDGPTTASAEELRRLREGPAQHSQQLATAIAGGWLRTRLVGRQRVAAECWGQKSAKPCSDPWLLNIPDPGAET